MTVKTHGHTVGQGMNIPRDNGQVNFNDMAEVNNTAILIIRNPFKALTLILQGPKILQSITLQPFLALLLSISLPGAFFGIYDI